MKFGLRWQPARAKRSEDWSAAATPLLVRRFVPESGVALRFPPQSKIGNLMSFATEKYPCESVFICGYGS
jgi:hypothetical protein